MKLTTFGGIAVASLITSCTAGFAVASALQPAAADPPPVARLQPQATPGSLLDSLVPTGASFEAGETVHVKGRLGHPTMAAGRSAKTYLHLDLTAETDLAAAAAPSMNLAIVLDRSRSMKGQRMQNAMAAARGMIDRLSVGDTLSVVAYNTQSTVVVPPTTITEQNRADLALRLRSVEARGHTCISCGVEAGLEQLAAGSGSVQRMLLLSDGQANTGVRDEPGFRRLAEQARARGVTVSSLGVDVDYDERLLLAVAEASNGRHYFVEDPAGLARVFEEELRSLQQTVASGVEAVIRFAPGMQPGRVFDRAFEREGDAIVVPFGTFAAGDAKTLLMEVRLPRSEAGLHTVADVQLRYRDLTQPDGESATCEGSLAVALSTDAAAVSALDPLVEARLARAETAQALRDANAAFALGNVREARATLEQTRGRIRTRRKASGNRVQTKHRKRVSADFDKQLDALDGAHDNFAKAEIAAPKAAEQSREGKSSVRQNADALSGLGL
ncbi:MAG: VWA domain-containing protein [Myxococcota bacterium]